MWKLSGAVREVEYDGIGRPRGLLALQDRLRAGFRSTSIVVPGEVSPAIHTAAEYLLQGAQIAFSSLGTPTRLIARVRL